MSSEFRVRDIRNAPFFWLQNEILTVYGPKIGAVGLGVYCIMAHSAGNSGTAKTSLRQLASTLAISPQTAMRSLETLIEHGLIKLVKKSKSAAEGPSIYDLGTVPIGNGSIDTVPWENRHRSVGESAPFRGSDTLNKEQEGIKETIEQPLSSKESFSLVPKEIISSKPKPKAKESSADPRHMPITDIIFREFKAANGYTPKWTGKEGKLLSYFLGQRKDWPLARVEACVVNRFRSEANLAEDVSEWIGRMAKYAAGPLNAYGQPKNGSNGNGKSKEDDRLARARAAINAGLSTSRGGNVVHDRPALPDRTD